MSLELGQLSFRPDTTPYRSPEARRRRRKRDRLAAKTAAGLPVAPRRRNAPQPGLEGETFSRLSQLSIMPDTLAPRDMAFPLGATQNRMGRSFAAAAVSHVVGVGLILLLISLSPQRVYDIIEPNRENYSIVWLPQDCTAPGFLDSGLTVFASTRPRPARRGRVAPARGFGTRISRASIVRCMSA